MFNGSCRCSVHWRSRPCRHNVYHNGVAAQETAYLIQALRDVGYSLETLRETLKTQQLSCRGSRSWQEVFVAMNPKYLTENNWRATCSQQQALWPLLHFWAFHWQDPRRSRIELQLRSFLLLCQRLWLINAFQYGRDPGLLPELFAAQERHHCAFHEAYAGCQRPKHHYALHIAAQAEQHGVAFDTLACERRHQVFKACVTSKLTSFRNWEGTVLAMMQEDDTKEAPESGWGLRFCAKMSKQEACAVSPWRRYDVNQPVMWTDRQHCGIITAVSQVEGHVVRLDP